MILTRMPSQLSPANADLIEALRRSPNVGRQRAAEQIGDRHLRLALSGSPAARLALNSPRAHPSEIALVVLPRPGRRQADTWPRTANVSSGSSTKRAIALPRRETSPCSSMIAQGKNFCGGTSLLFDVVERADHRVVDQPRNMPAAVFRRAPSRLASCFGQSRPGRGRDRRRRTL